MMLGFIKKIKRPFSDEELLKQYEDGKILQVDNKKDNKEYFGNLKIRKINPPKIKPVVKKKWDFFKMFKKKKVEKDGK